MDKKNIAYTPVMKQFLDIKSRYQDCLLLFRMGDFYETFFDDAILASKILGIILTKRSNGKASNVDLAGFPYHSLDTYLPKLVNAGHRVAICEQVEDPKLVKGIVKREVVEVVTPGTLISDQTLNNKSNRYIGSLYTKKEYAGYSFLDTSTGDFFLGECSISYLKTAILKYLPQEVILSEDVTYSTLDWYREYKPFITPASSFLYDYNAAYRELLNHFETKSLKGFGCEGFTLGISAAGALMQHIKNNLVSNLQHVSKITPIAQDGIMGLDAFTVKNLEIFNSLSNQGHHGTLIDCLDSTSTAGGGRLLRNWLINPITDIQKINKRLNITESFIKDRKLLFQFRETLKDASDNQRILGKIGNGKASPREVIAMALTLEKIDTLKKILNQNKNEYLNELSFSFLDTSKIYKKIKSTLNIDAPIYVKDGTVIIKGYDKELDELRVLLKSGKQWIQEFQDSMRTNLNIPKLKVGFNRVFGYYIEVTKVHQDKVPETFIRKQTLVNSERYITEELKQYEEKVLNAEEKIYQIELKFFNKICEYILKDKKMIQINADQTNCLDVYTSFSFNAIENDYSKPKMTDQPILTILKGRHPVVEKLLPATEKFIANDLTINSFENQIHLLTGPNMAGKSTYLRQIGLITLMGHIGSFVPAKQALIGVVDRLFTRVGASDNLAGGESTFLVEMNEASNILNNATDKSLILLDEIGRGTATYDGLSIAWAITEHLHNKKGLSARTLFATHYHELTNLENSLKRLENHHVEVKEYKDKIIFLRSIAKGPGDKSYGIHVAKMAGLPETIIKRAKVILNQYLLKSENKSSLFSSIDIEQVEIFDKKENLLKEKLETVDINTITPIEALIFLEKLKKEYDF